MKIAFHLYFMGLRGTEIATYDYAHYNEEILGNESVIVVPEYKSSYSHELAEQRFKQRFPVYTYDKIENIDRVLAQVGADAVYNHELFADANWVSQCSKTLVHGVFQWCKPRGDAFACVSEWLGRALGHPAVPLMISLPDIGDHMRKALNIPQEAIVFGRHGGSNTFNIPFVHKVIQRIVERRDDIYFLFMNTDSFMPKHPRVIHLEGTTNLEEKVRFINTCDAMIHARTHGESFGLAIGEFSCRNKPVITHRGGTDKAHFEFLNKKGLFYKDSIELEQILEHFSPDPSQNWDVYSKPFAPPVVMEKFKSIFID